MREKSWREKQEDSEGLIVENHKLCFDIAQILNVLWIF